MNGIVEISFALINLTLLEIVLGIDNILFISILSSRLPVAIQSRARRIGLLAALLMRVLLLLSLKWLTGLTGGVIELFNHNFSIRDFILLAGGLFLLAKASSEIFKYVESHEEHESSKSSQRSMTFVHFLIQICLIDMVFSLDSVITAIGLAKQVWVMVGAIIISVMVMIIFSDRLDEFIKSHPAIRILALSFLIVVGVVLIADGLGEHVPRGYIYFGMGYTLLVELLNIRRLNKQKKLAQN